MIAAENEIKEKHKEMEEAKDNVFKKVEGVGDNINKGLKIGLIIFGIFVLLIIILAVSITCWRVKTVRRRKARRKYHTINNQANAGITAPPATVDYKNYVNGIEQPDVAINIKKTTPLQVPQSAITPLTTNNVPTVLVPVSVPDPYSAPPPPQNSIPTPYQPPLTGVSLTSVPYSNPYNSTQYQVPPVMPQPIGGYQEPLPPSAPSNVTIPESSAPKDFL